MKAARAALVVCVGTVQAACGDPCTGEDCEAQSATSSASSEDASSSPSTSMSATASSSTTGETGTDASSDGSSSDATGTDTSGEDTEVFEPGALVIPMDTDYQDEGMLRAYGLVHRLLREGIVVRWSIRPGKMRGEADFEATTIDVRTGEDVGAHGYRGGPWIVTADDAATALPVVMAWQTDYPETTVHEASEMFSAPVSRRLDWAPTIAIFADANEDIARKYLLAAGIPDSTGDLTWPDDSPDVLSIEEVAGPTDTDHADGALFGSEDPIYCQFMSMHWDVGEAEANPEVIAELDSYLQYNTHFFAECQAVSAFENLGHFLTPNGLLFAEQPTTYDFHRVDSPFAQLDGEFASVGGSEPAYSLPPGDSYFVTDTVIISTAGSPEGEGDVWMTGFRHGACPPDDKMCPGAGKISYLGGHEYDVALPISEHPETQGARLFLNSLFEAPCAQQ